MLAKPTVQTFLPRLIHRRLVHASPVRLPYRLHYTPTTVYSRGPSHMLRAVSTRIPLERPDDVDVDVETAIQAAGINDDDWLQKLLEVDNEQLILIISYLVNKNNIDNKSLKRARIELPSFSTAKWAEFAARAGLPTNPRLLQFEYFGTPVYQLPPSFHNAVFENSWRTQDVYQEPVEQTKEESRVRILDPYIVPILALFQGRVVDRPEETMPPTVFATGGEIEHEIVMIGGILFFVIEIKQDKPTNNNMAQFFLELLSAANLNKNANFEGLRVYGVLTNLTRFAFFSYDPMSNTFCRDEEIFIDTLRDGFASGMIHITNKIFGLVLSAFIDGLRATVQKNNQRDSNHSGVGASLRTTLPHLNSNCKADVFTKEKLLQKSTDRWDLALDTAEDCRRMLMEKVTTLEEMEVKSTEALELLTKSVRYIPRYSAYTTKKRSSSLTPAELKDHARQIVESTLQEVLP